MRRKIVAGNWKMNMLPNEALELTEKLIPLVKNESAEVIVCVPFINLFYTLMSVQGTNLHIGAQNMHEKDSGAFTGEISGEMLASINTEYVIIGHSERRKYFNETDETIALKVKKALEKNLKPIICVGETEEERVNGKTEEIIKNQIEKDLSEISSEDIDNIIIAYEPVWAIGTGKTATKEDANNVIKMIRETIKNKFNTDDISILYGGSVNSKNSKELFEMSDIDGGLIGGASLVADEFIKIVQDCK